MMQVLSLAVLVFFVFRAQALSFNDAVKSLEKHESVEALVNQAEATSKEAGVQGSWGDPQFRIAAKNFPLETLKDDQTPMTGIEFGVSQKVALGTKYGNIEKAFQALSKAYKLEAQDRKKALVKGLWEILIAKRRLEEDISILNENQTWIAKILKISKKLYANGKISQQAILDIQIRNSEIESEISNKKFELSQLEDNLSFIISLNGTNDGPVEVDNIPWAILNGHSVKSIDYKALALKEKLISKDLNLTAAKLNYIPDITVSLGVTTRSNIDGHGDFVGAMVSFPIPVSSQKYSAHGKAAFEKTVAIKNYNNYKRGQLRDISVLKKDIQKLKKEIEILEDKTIKFATNSRAITAKSYGLGNSSYVELLQSELKLQKILMHKVELVALRDIKKVTLKYVLGEPLHE